jgi:hypothetical protein
MVANRDKHFNCFPLLNCIPCNGSFLISEESIRLADCSNIAPTVRQAKFDPPSLSMSPMKTVNVFVYFAKLEIVHEL